MERIGWKNYRRVTCYLNESACSPGSDDDFVVVRHDTEIRDPLGLLSTTLLRSLKETAYISRNYLGYLFQLDHAPPLNVLEVRIFYAFQAVMLLRT